MREVTEGHTGVPREASPAGVPGRCAPAGVPRQGRPASRTIRSRCRAIRDTERHPGCTPAGVPRQAYPGQVCPGRCAPGRCAPAGVPRPGRPASRTIRRRCRAIRDTERHPGCTPAGMFGRGSRPAGVPRPVCPGQVCPAGVPRQACPGRGGRPPARSGAGAAPLPMGRTRPNVHPVRIGPEIPAAGPAQPSMRPAGGPGPCSTFTR